MKFFGFTFNPSELCHCTSDNVLLLICIVNLLSFLVFFSVVFSSLRFDSVLKQCLFLFILYRILKMLTKDNYKRLFFCLFFQKDKIKRDYSRWSYYMKASVYTWFIYIIYTAAVNTWNVHSLDTVRYTWLVMGWTHFFTLVLNCIDLTRCWTTSSEVFVHIDMMASASTSVRFLNVSGSPWPCYY